MALVGGGAQAELAVVDEAHALPVPAGLSWPEAGGFMEAYATAYDALFGQAGLTLGDRVLVTGAAGGVGTAAVQLAAAAGARVVASVRDRAQHAAVAALGAAEVVEPGDVEAHGPYDVVLELVGAASLPSALESLAIGARVVVIGVGSGALVEIDLSVLMRARARICASTLRARPERREGRARRDARRAGAAGARRGPPARARGGHVRRWPTPTAAYERFAAGGKVGKVVLTDVT